MQRKAPATFATRSTSSRKRASRKAASRPRSYGTLTSGLGSVDEFEDTVIRYAAIGVTDLVVHWPRANEPYKADYSIFERIFAR